MNDKQTYLPKSSMDFLEELKINNNRDWFNANKTRFLEQQAFIEKLADRLLADLQKHDLIETPSGKKSLYRIYRDTRFSKEKIPFKTHWSGRFVRATKQLRGGYYFHLEPGNSYIAGGFFSPNPADMKRIRQDVSFDSTPIRKILESNTFVETFGELQGEQLTTKPKGFDVNDDAIDLLRFKQFLLVRNFTDQQVLNTDFAHEAGQTFINMRPFFDYMSMVLTADGDGLED